MGPDQVGGAAPVIEGGGTLAGPATGPRNDGRAFGSKSAARPSIMA